MHYQRALTFPFLALLALLSSCGDDGTDMAPPPPTRGDASTPFPDGGTPPGPGTPALSRCTVGEPEQLGDIELTVQTPDRAQVIARPASSDDFLVITAQPHCPSAPIGNCDGVWPPTGPETWIQRRAVLYSVPGAAGASASGPTMVNLGVVEGAVSETNTIDPRIAVVGDRLVVAWLDNPSGEAVNVWSQSVDLTTLAPHGSQERISDLEPNGSPDAWPAARKLNLVENGSSAVAVFESYQKHQASPSLHTANISSMGVRVGSIENLGNIPHTSDLHAAARSGAGEILFGNTVKAHEGTGCDYLLGVLGGDRSKAQRDDSPNACGGISVVAGGTAYLVNSGLGLRFRPLGSAGSPIGQERKLVDAQRGARFAHPSIVPFANGFIVAFVESSEAGETLRAVLIDQAGQVLSEEVLLEGSRTSISAPSMALASDGATVAVAWKDRVPTGQRTNVLRLHCE